MLGAFGAPFSSSQSLVRTLIGMMPTLNAIPAMPVRLSVVWAMVPVTCVP